MFIVNLAEGKAPNRVELRERNQGFMYSTPKTWYNGFVVCLDVKCSKI